MQNVVADGLTRVMSISSVEIPASKRHLFIEDCTVPRIFRLGGEELMIAEKLGDIEDDEEGAQGLEDVQKRGIFVHN